MKNSIQQWKDAANLMRIPFSLFLMPVYWFALSNSIKADIDQSIIVFLILHLLVYSASNGYNSWQDKDTGSIGGIKHPPKVNSKLLVFVIVFDLLSMILSFILIDYLFTLFILIYLLISKAYSYKKIRLKSLPLTGTLAVTFFQGAFIYMAVKSGINADIKTIDLGYALVSTLFLAGSFPLTQIYQHEEDTERGDVTLSILLGIKGTFRFAEILIGAGTLLLLLLYLAESRYIALLIFPLATIPVLVYFTYWKKTVAQNISEINYESTMRMNKISSICLSFAFIVIMLIEQFRLFS